MAQSILPAQRTADGLEYEYREYAWGDVIKGSKEVLQRMGIGLGISFPGEPGGNKRQTYTYDPRGFRCVISIGQPCSKGPAMLELDTLFAKDGASTVPNLANGVQRHETPTTQEKTANTEGGSVPEVGHSGHNGKAPVFGDVCPRNPLQHNGFDDLGTVGTLGTVALQGGDTKTGYRAPGGGADRDDFALHPAAVILLIAYCRASDIDPEEQSTLLIELGRLAPGEQVRLWQTACINKGMEPWRLLTIPASLEGHDCSLCTHLLTRQYAGESGRRQYHWACGEGYLILETGRGTERIWIAPPECTSWERWHPSDMR